MLKSELREEYKNKRALFSETEIDAMSVEIASKLIPFLTDKTHIHLFLPIAGNHEVNGWLIKEEIENTLPNIQTYGSVTNFKNNSLKHAPLNAGTSIKPGNIAIPEPISKEFVDTKVFDVILIPLFVSDENGFRVGYGGGFYDRFLKECREDSVKIGLNFFPPINSIEDTNAYDIALDVLITPTTLHLH